MLNGSDIAGSLAIHTYRTISEAIILFTTSTSEQGKPLTMNQEAELWTCALQACDGLRDLLRADLELDEKLRSTEFPSDLL